MAARHNGRFESGLPAFIEEMLWRLQIIKHFIALSFLRSPSNHTRHIPFGIPNIEDFADAPTETPSEQELTEISGVLETIDATTISIIATMDRNHELLQRSLRDVQGARIALEQSNDSSLAMRY